MKIIDGTLLLLLAADLAVPGIEVDLFREELVPALDLDVAHVAAGKLR